MYGLILGSLLAIAASPALNAQEGAARPPAELVPMLRSQLVSNGITRTKEGRLFSPFQRQERDKGIELGEWVNGKPVAYPNAAWNAWKPGEDATRAFVGLHAVRVGPDGDLWALDKGAAGFGEPPVPGGPKLVRIDLSTNTVRQVYPLDGATGPNSFVDDFRFNGKRIYLTDAGEPGLIVLNLENGHLRRVLDRHPSMTAQRPLTGEGRHLFDETGRPVTIHADQLEVSPDGRILYYQPSSGPLYRIETRYVDDKLMGDAERAKYLAIHAQTGSTGGTAIDAAGTIYASDTDALRILKIAPDGSTSTLIQDPRLVWGDAMWIDEEGGLWIPAAQMNRTKPMNGGRSQVELPTTIFRMAIGAKPVRN